MTKPLAQCGTTSGERRHRRERTPVCDACRAARNEDQRQRKAAQYVPQLAYVGGWIRDGLVLRPAMPRRPE